MRRLESLGIHLLSLAFFSLGPITASRCSAQTARPSEETPDAQAARTPVKLEQLAWLAGYWGDERTEECWLPPAGKLMLGVNRSVGIKQTSFEFLRIEQRQDGIYYLASPGGGPPTEFALVELAPQRVTFSNPQHDFPQTIVYTRQQAQLLVSVSGDIAGRPRQLEWRWRQRDLQVDAPSENAPQETVQEKADP